MWPKEGSRCRPQEVYKLNSLGVGSWSICTIPHCWQTLVSKPQKGHYKQGRPIEVVDLWLRIDLTNTSFQQRLCKSKPFMFVNKGAWGLPNYLIINRNQKTCEVVHICKKNPTAEIPEMKNTYFFRKRKFDWFPSHLLAWQPWSHHQSNQQIWWWRTPQSQAWGFP